MTQIAHLIEGRPLIHAESSERVREVAQRMSEEKVGAVAVLDRGKLVGIFSERDIMTRIVAEGRNPESTLVSSVMTRDIVVADPDEDVDEALRKMSAIGCRHLPVVSDGNLVGMISLRDLLLDDNLHTKARAEFLTELVTYNPDYED
jgi:CBS domain-containing protein